MNAWEWNWCNIKYNEIWISLNKMSQNLKIYCSMNVLNIKWWCNWHGGEVWVIAVPGKPMGPVVVHNKGVIAGVAASQEVNAIIL